VLFDKTGKRDKCVMKQMEDKPRDFLILAKHITKKLLQKFPQLRNDPDEVYSIALYAIGICVADFNPERGDWTYHAVVHGERRTMDGLRRAGLLRRMEYKKKPKTYSLEDWDFSYNDKSLEGVETNDICNFVLQDMPEKWRKAIIQYYFDENDMTTIASISKEDITKQGVNYRIQQGLKYAREKLGIRRNEVCV